MAMFATAYFAVHNHQQMSITFIFDGYNPSYASVAELGHRRRCDGHQICPVYDEYSEEQFYISAASCHEAADDAISFNCLMQ